MAPRATMDLFCDIQRKKCLQSVTLLIARLALCNLLGFSWLSVAAQISGNDAARSPTQEGFPTGRATEAKNFHELELHKLTERELSGNNVHHYRINLMKGQFAHVMVLQRGIDVVVMLRGPQNERILRVDSPNGTSGPESVSFVAEAGGIYTLTIAPLDRKTMTGRYSVVLEQMRIPTPNDMKRVEAERTLAKGFQLRNRLTEGTQKLALAEYHRAFTLFRDIGDHYSEGLIDRLIGILYLSTGRRKEAIERFNDARKLFREIHDLSAEASVLNDMGEYYLTLGQKQAALNSHDQAYSLFQSDKNPQGVAETLNHIGNVNYMLGEYQKALERYKEVIPLSRASHDRNLEALALESIGACHFELGNQSEARKFYKQALKIQRRTKDHLQEARTLINLVTISIWLGDQRELYNYYNQTLLLEPYGRLGDERLSDPSTIPSPTDLAAETYNKALTLSRASGNLFAVARVLNDIGSIHLVMHNNMKAVDSYNKALIANRRLQNLPGLGYTFHNLMICWKELRKPRLAIFYGKQAVNVYEEMRGYISVSDQESRTAFLKSKEATYRILGDLLISQKRLLEAQQVLNLLKEEEFFQFVGEARDEAASLNGRASLTSAEASLAEQYENLADRAINAAKDRENLLDRPVRGEEDRQRLTKLDSDARESNRTLAKFLKELEAFAESKPATVPDAEIPEARALIGMLAELGPGVVAIYTLVSDDRYSVMLISPNLTKAYQYSIKKDALRQKVNDLRDVLRDPGSNPIPLAHDLYRILVGPVAGDLKGLNARTLMWSLDGVIRTIPISALHDGEQYMIQRYQIEVFTPASQRALKDKPSENWKAFGFGVSKEHEDFPDLPDVPDELRAIIKDERVENAQLGIIPGKILIDEEFTEQAFLHALLEKSPVVHIASHFHFVANNALDSFLLLGDGSHLSLREIKASNRLFLGVELLTLSACDTATGGLDSNGKEVDGLAEFAQRQGAKAVVATLWPVADDSTRQIMQKFYASREAKRGVTKAEALMIAQLELLSCEAFSEEDLSMQRYLEPDAETECFSHPYYWAPFILLGNWR